MSITHNLTGIWESRNPIQSIQLAVTDDMYIVYTLFAMNEKESSKTCTSERLLYVGFLLVQLVLTLSNCGIIDINGNFFLLVSDEILTLSSH